MAQMNKRAADRANGYFLTGAIAILLLAVVAPYVPSSTSVLIWWGVAKGALVVLLLGVVGICAMMGFACLFFSPKDDQ